MISTFRIFQIVILSMTVVALSLSAQTPYQKKTATLMSPWGEALDHTQPILPEYPRPQMVREKWHNLNGIWQYQPAASFTEALPTGNLEHEILVPFPIESALSGIMEHHENIWYRRSFTVPADWTGQRVLLHFGAVDYLSEVFVNGKSVGTHQGGYDPFTFDVTGYLNETGPNDLALRVNDVTDTKGYPRGKQTLYPGGIMYTSTTGIWQTVWLEAVPQTYIESVRMTPDIDNALLNIVPAMGGTYIRGLNMLFKMYDNGVEISSQEARYSVNGFSLEVPKPLKLWSPENPFLYDMKVYLMNGSTVLDSVTTYFGMRKISKKLVDGYYRMCLNDEVLFQMGPLDQGFWPDGIYTAPTDEALRFDIEKTKEFGFNMIRKHIKVEPLRWYYWCDKLGILVWQDMPSMNSYINTALRPVPPREDEAYINELEAMIKNLGNSPSIVSWVVFNEYQGAHAESYVVQKTKSWDNSRLVNVGSGGPFNDASDVRDFHNYPAPVAPDRRNEQTLVCGEYGGIGYYVQNHIWSEGNPYETVNSIEKLLERYTSYADILIYLKSNKGLSAAVYTEITDVEMELNGLMTYDRKVIKGNEEDYKAVNHKIINEKRIFTDYALTSEESPQTWKYTLSQPAADWVLKSYNDEAWQTGDGGFGSKGTPGAIIGTEWKTQNIWMRRTFTLPANALESGKVMLKLHHDEACRVYINGVKALELSGFTAGYAFYDITPAASSALVLGGENTLAVYCNQTFGGQYIDVGVSVLKLDAPAATEPVKKNEVRIYPNPVVNTLNIERQHSSTEVTGIYNIIGKLVKSPAKNESVVDVSDLDSGMYFLKMKTDGFHNALSFIKE